MNNLIQEAFKEVKTENLLLRIPNQEDVHSILAIEGDPATNKYRPAGPMKDLGEAQESLNRWRRDWITYGYGYWSVVLPLQSEVVGIGELAKIVGKG